MADWTERWKTCPKCRLLKCLSCGTQLDNRMGHWGRSGSHEYDQPEDALEVEFKGGYGMYLDLILGATAKGFLCKTCADRLMLDHPWVERLFDRAEEYILEQERKLSEERKLDELDAKLRERPGRVDEEEVP